MYRGREEQEEGGKNRNNNNNNNNNNVIPDFKDKTRYAPYASIKSQISHIATNKG